MTNRFLPLRPRVNPEYLILMLNNDFVKDQLIAICRGAGAPDFRENKLSEVMIPVPDSSDLSSIDSFMEDVEDTLADKRAKQKEILEIDTNLKTMIDSMGNGLGQLDI